MEEKPLRNHKSQHFSEVIQSDPTWCLSWKSPSQKKSQTRRIARSVFFPWRIGFFPTTLQELLGALFVENDPRRPPFPQPGTDHTIPYFLQLGDASFKRQQLSSSRSTRWAQNNSLKWHRATINGEHEWVTGVINPCKWSVTYFCAHFVELEDWKLAEISSKADLHSRFQVCGADMSWFDSRKSRCSYVFHFRFLRSCFKFRAIDSIDNHKVGKYTNESQHDNEKNNLLSLCISHKPAISIFWSVTCDVFSDAVPFASFKHLKNYWRLELELVYFLSCQGDERQLHVFRISISVLPVWFDGSSRIWHVFEVDWSRILSGILGRWKPNFSKIKTRRTRMGFIWDLWPTVWGFSKFLIVFAYC